MDPEHRASFPDRLAPDDLRGASLRYSLLTLLHDCGPASISELRAELERRRLQVGGADPNKTIADALRLECAKGRAERVARGRYRAIRRPERTVRRHRARLRELEAELARQQAGAGPWP